MIQIRQCTECKEAKANEYFEVVDGKRSNICMSCFLVNEGVEVFDDEREFTLGDFDDQADQED